MKCAVTRRDILQTLVALGLAAPAFAKAGSPLSATPLKWRADMSLALSSIWHAGDASRPHALTFTLHNRGKAVVQDALLITSGPMGFDIASTVSNGKIVRRQGENTVFSSKGGPIPAGGNWEFVISWPGDHWGLFHWTDTVHAAYLLFPDGSVADVLVEPCASAAAARETPRLGVAQEDVPPAASASFSIIPWPAEVRCSADRHDVTGLALPADDATSAFADLLATLFPAETLLSPQGLKVAYREDKALPAEAYAIEFRPDGATLSASTRQGRFYGLVTLGQMVRGAVREPSLYGIPASGTIRDLPTHRWRGCMLDVARQFFGMGEIRRLLAIMAWNKLNRFHWHLCDDEGWRPEISAYPALTEIGAWRGEGLPIPAFCGSGARRYGGSYSKADMVGAVALASRFGIEIVPEIDMPGHFFAGRVAIPELSDPDEKKSDVSVQKFSRNVLNPGLDFTYRFVETVIGELADIFPSRYFHIGGDEVPDQAWAYSPAAQNRLKAIGGKTTADLQSHFLRRIQTVLKSHGRITGAWEEAAHGAGLDRADSYMVAWRKAASGPPLAAQGYEVVMAPGQPYYLNTALNDSWWEPGAAYYGSASLEACYAFDPLGGFAAQHVRSVIGVQACVWTLLIDQPGIFERLVFPRVSAVAETGWSDPRTKDFARFQRAARLMPTLYEKS